MTAVMPSVIQARNETCVTGMVLSAAAERADGLALVPDAPGQHPAKTYSYARLAATVEAAASGLAWRGLRARDVVGVLVPDAASFILARHAIHAVGGVPSPVDPGLSLAEMAGQLAESGARMLITGPPLAEQALAAADRSWVRQVFSFADAPGTTPFRDLLGVDIVRPDSSRADDVALMPFSRGQDGRLRPIPLTHREACVQLGRVDAEVCLSAGDVVLVTPPGADGLSYTLATDSAMLRGATVVATATGDLAGSARRHTATAAIVPPDGAADVPAGVRVIPLG